jgi:hypothetical protein
VELSHLRSGKCGVCQQALEGDALTVCGACSAAYHPECWEYNGRRCAVFGCFKDPFPRRPLPAPQRPVDIFNSLVLAAFGLAIAAVMYMTWVRFSSF